MLKKDTLEYINLTFSKLTDPGRQGSNDNLSLEQLVMHANGSTAPDAYALRQKLDELKDNSRKLKELRNKFIIHSDLRYHMKYQLAPTVEYPRLDIETYLKLLREFVNILEKHHERLPIKYYLTTGPGDAGGSKSLESLKDAEKCQ